MAQQAPDFALQALNGEALALSQLRGRPVIVNFFKSTCGYCADQMPKLQEVYTRHKGDPVHIIGVAVGNDDAAAAGAFAKEKGLQFPIAVDADRTVRRAYGLLKVPTLVVVGKEGEVLATYVGATERLAGVVDQTLAALVSGGTPPDYAEEGGG